MVTAPSDDAHTDPRHERADRAITPTHNENQRAENSKSRWNLKKRRDGTQTHARRRHEKMALLEEINKLQLQLRKLKMERSRHLQSENLTLEKRLSANFLADAVKKQQVPLVSVQFALSSVVHVQTSLPEALKIRLRTDRKERRRVLKEITPKIIRQALGYLAERERFVDPTIAHADMSRFLDSESDYCALLFDTVPFEGIQTVMEVYDALKFYYSNMEIRVTETLGDVTIREDDGDSDVYGAQCRIVSYLSKRRCVREQQHYQREVRSEFGDGRAVGVFTENFVDQDDLFPYLPNQRLLLDVTVVVRINSQLQTRHHTNNTQTQELLVVLARSGHVKLHKTKIPLPPAILDQLREGIAQWGDVMLKAVRELVYHHG